VFYLVVLKQKNICFKTNSDLYVWSVASPL